MKIKSTSHVIYLIDSLDVWHVMLGHLNFNSIRNMFKLELIFSSYIEKQEKSNICVQSKSTKNHFLV